MFAERFGQDVKKGRFTVHRLGRAQLEEERGRANSLRRPLHKVTCGFRYMQVDGLVSGLANGELQVRLWTSGSPDTLAHMVF